MKERLLGESILDNAGRESISNTGGRYYYVVTQKEMKHEMKCAMFGLEGEIAWETKKTRSRKREKDATTPLMQMNFKHVKSSG